MKWITFIAVVAAFLTLTGPSTALFAAAGSDEVSLPAAVSHWIGLLEKDQRPEAIRRWAKDATAAEQMTRSWADLQAAHKQHDYRRWLETAGKDPDVRKFTVGGHDASHLHVVWERSGGDWRISAVFMCR